MADKKELTADQQAELDEIFARARAALEDHRDLRPGEASTGSARRSPGRWPTR
jgi:hypothetical protein